MRGEVLCSPEAFGWKLSSFTRKCGASVERQNSRHTHSSPSLRPAPVTHASSAVSQWGWQGSGQLPSESTRLGFVSEDVGAPMPTLDLSPLQKGLLALRLLVCAVLMLASVHRRVWCVHQACLGPHSSFIFVDLTKLLCGDPQHDCVPDLEKNEMLNATILV